MSATITKSSNWLIEGVSKETLEAEKILSIISAQIQLKRIEMNLDQKQFAKLLGVTQGMVSRWESGCYNFTITTLVNICEKLGLSFVPQITSKEVDELIEQSASSIIFNFNDIEREDYSNWRPKINETSTGEAA